MKMKRRTICSKLLGSAIVTATITLALSNCFTTAFAFSSPSLLSARSKSLQPHEPTTISVCSSKTTLFGYANVNDYFNSFSQDNNDQNDDNSSNDQNELKYIGHGRIGASNDSGGAFDVNNYFASFGGQSQSGDNTGDITSSAAQYDDENEQSIANNSSDEVMSDDNTLSQPIRPQGKSISEIIAYNNARLCPKSFLTQSSIQSFIYLLEECRDPHSGKWIQDFLNLPNLSNYHGTAAFHIPTYPNWDSVLIDILRQPNQKMIVSAKRRGRGHGGWSKNNPYLQERWVEFKIDINPASLVQRLLSVREQLAVEFERDLEIVGIVDGMIMDSYFSTVRRERSSSSSNDNNMTKGHSIEYPSMFYPTLQNSHQVDQQAVVHSARASVHHLLRDLRESNVDSVSYQWLQKFYSERVSEYFDGDQAFGRADDFIDALLRSPPSLVSMDHGRSLGLTDPLRIAERIIAKRSEVAYEWIGMMKEVKEDHLVLNDMLYRVMMGKAIDASESNAAEVTIEEETTWEPLGDDAGVFE